ncbi:phosphate ABC transporter permease subunit PstC [Brachyspira hyodysenteriae]|uniref:phosphate ABC transporter permease subunit PstC n=1 Tax=Brachyspira hyodysenteriae TaxID=159 RepID=UPI001ADDA461|nr:phosphate ABC transporter permease subunit PstC [Brachyspira hyodysenteriae]MBT8720342.1 phosphate ABC transporter permease subunit PstC [Brachyspira hyodysenteriae]MBT8730580.1 phosphate ABC transporter permease subunit PstC [Brachyspira hyodysenteriae]MBT8732910.1 phosphate ABC transporter permease subunit PstC [Brachyspira hyodysenteriae]MBT8735686.1 phosphate ABC transporter permease subunit PstC [Brachyspira hyodysenteriae]MBT8738308.1 phosphate ABC transporter permease subunit PstC [B
MNNNINKHIRSEILDNIMKYVFFVCSIFSVIVVFSICIFIFIYSLPIFKETGFLKLVFGMNWSPSSKHFGIFPMIVGSVYITILSTLLGGGFGFFTAVYISMFAPNKLKVILSQVIDLLAGIPSIVYGFFGMSVLVPFLKNISPNDIGEGVLASSIILAVMILPTITSITKYNLEAVYKYYYDGARALGNTHSQAVFGVIVKAAKSGIFSAIVLGMGRAIGETMAVMMVAGNAPFIPQDLFSYFRTMTINIALEMGYATGIHRSALIGTAFVLLLFILIINIILSLLKRNNLYFSFSFTSLFKKNKELKTDINNFSFKNYEMKMQTIKGDMLKYISIFATAVSTLFLVFIVVFILVRGLPHITLNLLFGKSNNSQMTLLPAIVSTSMMLFMSLIIAIPLGVFAAIYLTEYSKAKSKLIALIRIFTDSLSGIPSIVFGLFGMLVFANLLGIGRSILAGSLTLVLIILPSIIRQTEETLMSIPASLREGSLALGASKVRTIFQIVLPCGFSGIMTSVILSIGRIVGESAALIYTAGAVRYMPKGYLSSGSSFSVMMWMFSSEGLYINQTFATASILLIMIIVLNALLFFVNKKLKKDY